MELDQATNCVVEKLKRASGPCPIRQHTSDLSLSQINVRLLVTIEYSALDPCFSTLPATHEPHPERHIHPPLDKSYKSLRIRNNSMAMADVVILPCTLSDCASIGRLKVTSFWTDPTSAILWCGKSREYVAEQCTPRHLKAVDRRTGRTVGYGRWALPPVEGVGNLWAQAVVPAAESEIYGHLKAVT